MWCTLLFDLVPELLSSKMVLLNFLETSDLPGNILELSVIKKIDIYRFIVGDNSALAELNLSANPLHAKDIKVGTTIKLLKPTKLDGKTLQTNKNFKPLKSQNNIEITPPPSADDLAQFETIKDGNLKVENIEGENNSTTFKSVEQMDNQAIIPALTVMVTKVSRVISSKFGKYQIAQLMDIEGQMRSINLYDGYIDKMEYENIYTLMKVKKTLIRKDDKPEMRLATSKLTKILDGREGDKLKFDSLSLGDSQIDGTIIGFSDVNFYQSCETHWKKLDDENFCPVCNGTAKNINKDFHTELNIQDSKSEDMKSFLFFKRILKRTIGNEDDEETIQKKLVNLEGLSCKIDFDKPEDDDEDTSIIPKRLKLGGGASIE